eukprot:TRINITY_DN12347_c0_g1_i2.p1 TRINITY_DN12347_c0_g1~~TRINITY_DN12347_c0_g1_i2.p1  ORF type:complete len:332 (+),score=33.96 TRINITY_DN12347_c0_g1_i2:35-1030(+)
MVRNCSHGRRMLHVYASKQDDAVCSSRADGACEPAGRAPRRETGSELAGGSEHLGDDEHRYLNEHKRKALGCTMQSGLSTQSGLDSQSDLPQDQGRAQSKQGDLPDVGYLKAGHGLNEDGRPSRGWSMQGELPQNEDDLNDDKHTGRGLNEDWRPSQGWSTQGDLPKDWDEDWRPARGWSMQSELPQNEDTHTGCGLNEDWRPSQGWSTQGDLPKDWGNPNEDRGWSTSCDRMLNFRPGGSMMAQRGSSAACTNLNAALNPSRNTPASHSETAKERDADASPLEGRHGTSSEHEVLQARPRKKKTRLLLPHMHKSVECFLTSTCVLPQPSS